MVKLKLDHVMALDYIFCSTFYFKFVPHLETYVNVNHLLIIQTEILQKDLGYTFRLAPKPHTFPKSF